MLCPLFLIICIILINNSVSMAAIKSRKDVLEEREYFDSIIKPMRMIMPAKQVIQYQRSELENMMVHVLKDLNESMEYQEMYKLLLIQLESIKRELKNNFGVPYADDELPETTLNSELLS